MFPKQNQKFIPTPKIAEILLNRYPMGILQYTISRTGLPSTGIYGCQAIKEICENAEESQTQYKVTDIGLVHTC